MKKNKYDIKVYTMKKKTNDTDTNSKNIHYLT